LTTNVVKINSSFVNRQWCRWRFRKIFCSQKQKLYIIQAFLLITNIFPPFYGFYFISKVEICSYDNCQQNCWRFLRIISPQFKKNIGLQTFFFGYGYAEITRRSYDAERFSFCKAMCKWNINLLLAYLVSLQWFKCSQRYFWYFQHFRNANFHFTL
jgi:hypothetical protein